MARGRVTFGSRELTRAIERYGDDVLEEVKQIVVGTAQIIQSTAKALAPVDSSALRDSIEMEVMPGGLKAKVQVTAEHAIWVEFGTGIYAEGPGGSQAKKIPWSYFSPTLNKWVTTSGNPAQPYWEPAIDAGRRYFQREMRRLG